MALNIADDDVVESTEEFSVSLSTADAKVTIGTHGTATVNIIDNDRKYTTLSITHMNHPQQDTLQCGLYNHYPNFNPNKESNTALDFKYKGYIA